MKIHNFDAVVIGTGCAGYNCADWLYDLGYKNIAIVTEGRYMGTSRNTGSDKQTYYKLSLCGAEGDSVREMADTLYLGGGVMGVLGMLLGVPLAAAAYTLIRNDLNKNTAPVPVETEAEETNE